MNFFFENLEIPTIFLIFSLCQPPRKKNCAAAVRFATFLSLLADS